MILSEYLNFSLNFIDIAQQLKIPFFAHAHGYDVSSALRDPDIKKKYLRYNDAAGVITMSNISRMRLIELGLQPSKVHVIPYGVEVSRVPEKRSLKSEVRCLAVGRMVAKKAPIYLLEAFRQAATHCPNLHLDYIGAGELLPAVRQYVHAFQLDHRITIHGGQSSDIVQKYMREADIFLQHSIVDPDSGDEEGLPVAILEAMANALPIISTVHAGIPEAVVDSETGFLVNEGDCSNMAQKITLLAQNSSSRVKFGIAGWQRSKELFTWERQRNDLRELMKLA